MNCKVRGKVYLTTLQSGLQLVKLHATLHLLMPADISEVNLHQEAIISKTPNRRRPHPIMRLSADASRYEPSRTALSRVNPPPLPDNYACGTGKPPTAADWLPLSNALATDAANTSAETVERWHSHLRSQLPVTSRRLLHRLLSVNRTAAYLRCSGGQKTAQSMHPWQNLSTTAPRNSQWQHIWMRS